MFHNNLGNALRLLGDRAQAGDHFRQAIRIDSNLAEAHSNLGQLLLEQYALPDALHHCREAVRLNPDFPEAHNNLGNVLREQGKPLEARACYAEALRLNPDLAVTYNNMGQALQEDNNLQEAVSWYQKALELDSASARIHCNLASALEEQEDYAKAIAQYQTALELDATHAEAHNGLGFAVHEQGGFQEALTCYREAVRLRPDFAAAHTNMGTVLQEMGDFEAALGCFREAIRLRPRHAGAYGQLATMLLDRLPDADFEAMQQLLAEPDLAAGKRCALHFGLAHVLDAKGVYVQAAEHMQRANELCLTEGQKRGKGYDPTAHRQFVDRIIATFTPDCFERVKGFGLETERPVFIVGLPRSGTTLVEQILASHSQVFGAGELRHVQEAFQALPSVMGVQDTPFRCVERLDRETAPRMAQAHLDKLLALNDKAPRITDKMPDNYLYLGFISALFPKAKVIHCRRNLRDVAVSWWITSFRHLTWASDIEHIASRFQEYERLTAHWKTVLPGAWLQVDYEETVADLESVARRLVAWCGLDWEAGCLAFHQTRRPIRTASVVQVRQPIYKQSAGRWKNYEKQLAALFEKIGPASDRPAALAGGI